MPAIPVLRRLTWMEHHKFEFRLGYIVKPCLEEKKETVPVSLNKSLPDRLLPEFQP